MKQLFFDLGDGTSLPARQVVLILNAETATQSAVTRDFLRQTARRGEAETPLSPLKQVNSFVLTNSRGRDRLYSSARTSSRVLERKLGKELS